MDDVTEKRTDRLHLVLMLALTFSTGIIDATGYLGLDRVFTGNMTGNVVVLGMGLLGADHLPVIGPLIALGCFMAGAAVAGRAVRPVAAGWSTRSTVLFVLIGGVILALGVAALFTGAHLPLAVQYTITGMLGVAMGMQAGAARHIAVKDVTTVVVTSTLTGLASDSVLGGGRPQPWKRRALAVLLILLGALTGAAALHLHISVGLFLAALITLAVAAIGHVDARRIRRAEALPA